MSLLRRRHRPGRNLLDLTPMVDIALTLVVFMLLGGELSEREQLPVLLPIADTGEGQTEAVLRVRITADDALYIDDQAVVLGLLEEHAAGVQQAIIEADTQASHGAVVAVEDALRAAGVQQMWYRTQAPQVEEW